LLRGAELVLEEGVVLRPYYHEIVRHAAVVFLPFPSLPPSFFEARSVAIIPGSSRS
jgi:hypothetical protein